MEIAERLQELRQSANYSQEQVADILGISRQAISKWESGQVKPEIDNIIKLTEIHNTTTDYILLGKKESSRIEQLPPKESKRTWQRVTIHRLQLCDAFTEFLDETPFRLSTNYWYR